MKIFESARLRNRERESDRIDSSRDDPEKCRDPESSFLRIEIIGGPGVSRQFNASWEMVWECLHMRQFQELVSPCVGRRDKTCFRMASCFCFTRRASVLHSLSIVFQTSPFDCLIELYLFSGSVGLWPHGSLLSRSLIQVGLTLITIRLSPVYLPLPSFHLSLGAIAPLSVSSAHKPNIYEYEVRVWIDSFPPNPISLSEALTTRISSRGIENMRCTATSCESAPPLNFPKPSDQSFTEPSFVATRLIEKK